MSESDGLIVGADGKTRCFWGGLNDDYIVYHDNEWGRPVADDIRLFEKICLEGFQSGLSWLTILRKRENFRKAFAGFDFNKVARFGDKDVERLLQDAGIVRHRGKIESTINNAKRAKELVKEEGSIAAFVWRYEPDPASRPKTYDWDTLRVLAKTPESTALSKDLKKRGWSFVGPTTMYAFMQGVGIVNDHVEGCFVREVVEDERRRFKRPS
ncbi:DNA-3-methyladenine glycosylase I [Bauldia sp.]|uniref:DNA-3-methyladenine glycosylase I n=1 Tax=Bauldia sp. TaxID=2575872 RepID=UPI003BA887B8